MEIVNAIVHKIIKESGVVGATTQDSDEELERTGELNDLMFTLLDSYNNRSSRYAGSFNTDTNNYPLSSHLQRVLNGKISFKDFSDLAVERLREEMNSVVFASGGYLLLMRYSHNDRDMLLIAKLNSQSGAIFSEDLHKVVRAPYLNLDKLQVAARVDLRAWLEDAERYLTFVLRRDKDAGPSDYFQNFVGCQVDQDSKAESKKLVIVVRDFANGLVEAGVLPENEMPDVRRRAFDYADALRKSDAPRVESFEALANAVWPDEPEAFLRFFNNHDEPPSAGFVPDATTIKALSDINYRSKELTLKMTYEFKSAHVRVVDGKVVIEQAPDRLLRELAEG
ncbi:nucleoid-associated protein [Salinisphaera sp. T31B1]|uniref:nucleoid-associated protein n=1 Tax=Salinisphaera sp. T31B1 TaxID=727963 RepID=UPI0033426250